MRKKILIVEDDNTLSDVLVHYLNNAGHDCQVINNGLNVMPWFSANRPDMVLLDVVIPGINGIELCGQIRAQSNVPIIMVTGKSDEMDRLRGLDKGADDYICKPFRPREVVARVGAIFRRVEPNYGIDNATSLVAANDEPAEAPFRLDAKRHRLYVAEKDVTLTTVQCNVLALLMDNEGVIMSREEVIGHIYPDNRVVCDRTIDSHIRELRKNIASILPNNEVIFAVYGAGYKFEMPVISPVAAYS